MVEILFAVGLILFGVALIHYVKDDLRGGGAHYTPRPPGPRPAPPASRRPGASPRALPPRPRDPKPGDEGPV